MASVTFIGLGRMGLGMAQRLLAAGHRLRVYNRTPSKATSLVAQVVRNARRMVEGDHDRNILFTPQLRLKDVDTSRCNT